MFGRLSGCQKINNIANRAKQRLKLDREHLAFIKNYVKAIKNQPVTVLQLRLELLKKFPNLGKVSCVTIRRAMKKELGLSYQKLDVKAAKMMTKELERSVMENLGLVNALEQKGVEIIYRDEFHFNTRHSRFRGWAKMGSKAFLAIDPTTFQATFAVAVSKEKIYGIIESTETMDGA